ncbi:YdcF family protein [Mucilaginibacter sp. KACC 22063]|uniref:YdcF family protein n=1 Tax=Mucilaginibacter sp. KACC 22063 TaxID=3025666 RepID=UPI002366C648|nr:YdcF family protein [Mucilaginibacter sp. KACC 22063]WDF53860.1 YdcF family protein [Mucilaginibacter sp. KACC 22063]
MFVLSKVLLFLLFPFTWILILLVWACITKNIKRKQRLLISSLLLIYIFSIPILVDLYSRAWHYPDAKLNGKKYSAVIVLGGFSSEGYKNQGYFNAASDRFIQGVKLYETGKAAHILISSGSGNLIDTRFKEADWVYGQLKAFNIPDSNILIEDKSRNTLENALFSKQILKEHNIAAPYILVTSDFHMRRSVMLFKKAGLAVLPYSCNYDTGLRKISPESFLPESFTLFTWERYTKELVGYIVDGFLRS